MILVVLDFETDQSVGSQSNLNSLDCVTTAKSNEGVHHGN